MGEEKIRTCCKIVVFGLDVWAGAAIEIEAYNRKEGPNNVLSETAVAEEGGFLNTFYHSLWMNDTDK